MTSNIASVASVTIAVKLDLKSQSALIPYEALLNSGQVKDLDIEAIMDDPAKEGVLMAALSYWLGKAKSVKVQVVGIERSNSPD